RGVRTRDGNRHAKSGAVDVGWRPALTPEIAWRAVRCRSADARPVGEGRVLVASRHGVLDDDDAVISQCSAGNDRGAHKRYFDAVDDRARRQAEAESRQSEIVRSQ